MISLKANNIKAEDDSFKKLVRYIPKRTKVKTELDNGFIGIILSYYADIMTLKDVLYIEKTLKNSANILIDNIGKLVKLNDIKKSDDLILIKPDGNNVSVEYPIYLYSNDQEALKKLNKYLFIK